MFEPFIDGLIDEITTILKKSKKTFGIGGIGKLGWEVTPTPECLINEHIRLNSSGVILSRSFKGNFDEKKMFRFEQELSNSVKDFRDYEKFAKSLNQQQLLKSYLRMKKDIKKL